MMAGVGIGVMNRPPRDPKITITNRDAIFHWVLYAATLFIAALLPLVAGPDDPKPDAPSVSMTMTFVVMGLGTIINALTNRRDPATGLAPPILKAAMVSAVPLVAIVLATQLPTLQHGMLTMPLTGRQWLVCFGLAALFGVVVEGAKLVRRRQLASEAPKLTAQRALAPERASVGD